MTKTIASIYYEDLSAERSIYGGRWKVSAIQKGAAPFLLEVKDHYQMETEPWFRGSFGGKQLQVKKLVAGQEIAVDLLTQWTGSHPDCTPDCSPGLWIVRDVIYLSDENGKPILDGDGKQQFRPATAEEASRMFAEDLAAAVRRQAAWGEKAIQKGDMMAEDPKRVQFIPDYCKASATYYGRDRAWLRALTDGDIKTCQFCAKVIASNVVKCPHCTEVVDPVRYAALKAQGAAAVQSAATKPKAA